MIMKLDEYRSFVDKQRYFATYDRFDTKQNFDCWYAQKIKESYDDEKTNGKFVFRGLNEAKYRLYTSGQREWLTKEFWLQNLSYQDFQNSILKKVKSNSILNNYFKSINAKTTDLLYMSFLQHYGAPTSLLDFTYSLNTALFFATDDLTFVPISQQSLVNDYFSIYYIELENCNFFSYLSFTSEFSVKINKPASISENTVSPKNSNGTLFDKIVFVPNPLKRNGTVDKTFSWSNVNIIAQEGCFFWYPEDKKPFEEGIRQKILPIIKLHCVDIHKSLADYVREKTGLSRKDVYPELKDLALESYETFKKELK